MKRSKSPKITYDKEGTEEEYQMRCDIFEGILPVEKRGMPFYKRGSERCFWFAPWDEIVRWTGIKEILIDMFRRPDYVHGIIDRMVTAWLPLHHKIDIIKKNIPRLRKISMSPWVDFDKAVENVRDEIVFAWKPNPAVLAASVWDPEAVRKDMEEKLEKAENCIVEIHMKDISTVKYQPQRLWEWAQIAAEVTEKYAV